MTKPQNLGELFAVYSKDIGLPAQKAIIDLLKRKIEKLETEKDFIYYSKRTIDELKDLGGELLK